MSFLLKMKGSTKNHLLVKATDHKTVCKKKVKPGELTGSLPKGEMLNLCHNCYAWVGKEMIVDWLGLDFYE